MIVLIVLMGAGVVLASGEPPDRRQTANRPAAYGHGGARVREASPYRLRYYEPFTDSEVGPAPVEGAWPRASSTRCGFGPSMGGAAVSGMTSRTAGAQAYDPCPEIQYPEQAPPPYGALPTGRGGAPRR